MVRDVLVSAFLREWRRRLTAGLASDEEDTPNEVLLCHGTRENVEFIGTGIWTNAAMMMMMDD